MQISFRKAEKKRSKLRLALIAPSGFGKTYSALRIATGLGGKIAMIDTEAGRGDLYGSKFSYDIVTMSAPFMPEKYIAAIKSAEEAGYDTVIIDSLSHAWAGDGGLLDQHGKIADTGKNSFAAWRTITPKHNQLIDAIVGSQCHIIATIRAKQDFVPTQDENGKTVIKKMGLAPVQRDGLEYEFTCVLDLYDNHTSKASKDNTDTMKDSIFVPSEETGKQLKTWLDEETPAVEENNTEEVKKETAHAKKMREAAELAKTMT